MTKHDTYTAPMAGFAIVLALLIATEAQAQQRTFYGADGRVTGRAITGSNGTTTFYDSNGRRVGGVTTTKPQASR